MLFRLLIGAIVIQTSVTAQTTFKLMPEVLTQCNADGLAQTHLMWRTSEAVVQVRIGSSTGSSMTGFDNGNGGANTGEWVTDGMVFVLVNSAGREMARAPAQVRCDVANADLVKQLSTQSYFPLAIGNRWIYRYTDRAVTATYITRSIERTIEFQGQTYYVMRESRSGTDQTSETYYRIDDTGRIYHVPPFNIREFVFLDPKANYGELGNPPPYSYVFYRNVRVSTPFGIFPNGIGANAGGGEDLDQLTLSPGIGLVRRERTNRSGTQYRGFLYRLELVEAELANQRSFRSSTPDFELGLEYTTVDITGRQPRNCAVPCYSLDCESYNPDPRDTYKPCMFTRLRVQHEDARSVTLDLVNAANEVVYSASRPVSSAEDLWYQSVPLYQAPAAVLPPGSYQVRATAKSDAGEILNTSTATFRLE